MAKKTGKSPANHRVLWVDGVRGMAIMLMIVFHFCYDLRYFGYYVDWAIPNGPGWWQFRYLILTLFIGTVGVSLTLAHGRQFRRKAFYKRLWQLLAAAAGITVMSLLVFPKAWIYFGILHFIAAGTLLSIGLVRRPHWALALGSLILIGYWLGWLPYYWPFRWFSQWLPPQTEDFVPLFPWLGVLLVSMAAAALLPIHRIQFPQSWLLTRLQLLGRHGLLIYLLHQPLLFAGFLLVQFARG